MSKQVSKFNIDDTHANYNALCAGCENVKVSRTSKSFKSVQSLKLHLERCSSFLHLKTNGKKSPPKEEILSAIKNAQKKHGKDVPFDLIPEFQEWNVLIK